MRRWDSLRPTRTPAPEKEIDRLIKDAFSTGPGRAVLEHLWREHVISQMPMGADERAYREAEGKKRLVLDLVRVVEEPDRVAAGAEPNVGAGAARKRGAGR